MGDLVALPRRGNDEPWITKKQLRTHLGVSDRAIEKWIGQGMPHFKLGANKRTAMATFFASGLLTAAFWAYIILEKSNG